MIVEMTKHYYVTKVLKEQQLTKNTKRFNIVNYEVYCHINHFKMHLKKCECSKIKLKFSQGKGVCHGDEDPQIKQCFICIQTYFEIGF